MIRVFESTDKSFTTNGDIVILPTKAKVTKKDNGDYYLDLEASTKYADYLTSGRIIVADTPQGAQAFRISDLTKKSIKVSLKAWHVFYDSKNYLIADSYVVDMTANSALDHLNEATEPKSEFVTTSDVQSIDSFRCVRKSLYEAIQTVIERWGGHLVRDNFRIELRQSIGADNGVTVRYRKNLKELTCKYDWSSVVTKLLPVGADGILLNDQNAGASIYVESEQKWDIPYTKTVSFSQSGIKKDDYGNDETAYRKALVDDLRRQAQDYVNKNCVPKANYTLKADLERVTDIGDTVEVIDERLGVHILTSVIGFTYDCILGKYTEIEFGNFSKTLSGLAGTLQSSAQSTAQSTVNNAIQGVTDTVTQTITQSMGASYVIYDGSKIMVLDSLPKEEAHNVILINDNGIAFSRNGIAGTFESAWGIDGTMNMQNINVINFVADLIKGGTLKLGGSGNGNGVMEVRSAGGSLLGQLDKDGLRMWANDGSRIEINASQGLVGYDANGNPTYGVTDGVFYMANGYVNSSLAVGGLLKMVPIQTDASTGIAFVALA
ncbi:phage tail spike protein [uncultured Senegalimassilia sp.]|uniref:phage tail spike protein n=1 Tax=uncultured Senegalimassilia sp. TaxID=1714350 RepID=UPI00261C9F3C|nr:phage tail spike protein [uncultured Senegalimassilia sp.]